MIVLSSSLDCLHYGFFPEETPIPEKPEDGFENTFYTRGCFWEFPGEAYKTVKDNNLHSYICIGMYPKVWKLLNPFLDEFTNLGIHYRYFIPDSKYRFGKNYREVEKLNASGYVYISLDTDKYTKAGGIHATYLLYMFIRACSIRKDYRYHVSRFKSLDKMLTKFLYYDGEEDLTERGTNITLDLLRGLNNVELMDEVFTHLGGSAKYFIRQTEGFSAIGRALK